MQPNVSVVVPAYNEEKLLSFLLDSLREQSYPKELTEIIVVDNNSTDQTGAVAKAGGATVYAYKEIQTSGAARRFGCEKAGGEILLFIDSDCIAPPDWIAKCVETLDRENLALIAGRLLPNTPTFSSRAIFGFYDLFFRLSQWYGKPIGWGSNMAIRADVYHAVGGFNPHLSNTEDWDLMKRVQKRYGRKKIRYKNRICVSTATRKQDNAKIFLKYGRDGILNYINVILLNRSKKITPMIIVR